MPSNDDDWSKSSSVHAVSFSYTVPQKWWPVFTGRIYEVDMTDLAPSTTYKYRVGGWDNMNKTMQYSQPFTFKSAPLQTDPNQKTVIAALADQGTFELLGFAVTRKMVEVQKTTPFDFVFVAGDLSYAGLDSDFRPLNITKDDEVGDPF